MSKTTTSKFYCLKCGERTFLPRRLSKMREKGHFKKIYCIKCKGEVNHLEVREFDLGFSEESFLEDVRNGVYKEITDALDGGDV